MHQTTESISILTILKRHQVMKKQLEDLFRNIEDLRSVKKLCYIPKHPRPIVCFSDSRIRFVSAQVVCLGYIMMLFQQSQHFFFLDYRFPAIVVTQECFEAVRSVVLKFSITQPPAWVSFGVFLDESSFVIIPRQLLICFFGITLGCEELRLILISSRLLVHSQQGSSFSLPFLQIIFASRVINSIAQCPTLPEGSFSDLSQHRAA